jgi:phage shock protein C
MNTEHRTDPRPRNRLYRNPQRGMIAGVCAGVAEYFGFDLAVTRVLVVIAALFSFPLMCIAYLAAVFLVPRKPASDSGVEYAADSVERQVRSNPHDMLSSVRYRFRDLDSRLQRLEKYVTSNRFSLDREFRSLKD